MSCGESLVSLSEQLEWLHHNPELRWAVRAALVTLQTSNACGWTFSCIPACNLIDVCLVICLRLNYSLSLLNKCFVYFWWVSALHNISPSLFHLLWCIHLFLLWSYYWERLLLGGVGSPSGVSERLYTVIIWLGEMQLLLFRFKLLI